MVFVSSDEIRENWNLYHDDRSLQLTTPYEWLVKFVKPRLAAGYVCLDVGAGSGNNAVWLAGQGCNVVAVDYVENARKRTMELARENGVQDRIRFEVLDVSGDGAVDEIFEDERYDIVVMHQILDHMRKRNALNVMRYLAKANINKAPIFLSLLTDKCAGSNVRGIESDGSYLSPIAASLGANKIELHSFYTIGEIQALLSNLPDHCLSKVVMTLDQYMGTGFTADPVDQMQTCHMLLEPVTDVSH